MTERVTDWGCCVVEGQVVVVRNVYEGKPLTARFTTGEAATLAVRLFRLAKWKIQKSEASTPSWRIRINVRRYGLPGRAIPTEEMLSLASMLFAMACGVAATEGRQRGGRCEDN